MALLLAAPPATWTENDFKSISLSGFPNQKRIEAAGSAHLELVTLRSKGIFSANTENPKNVSSATSAPKAKKAKSKHFITDYYELLELGHLRWKATEKDIKKAYRKMILYHHPDKQAQCNDSVDEEVFKSITEAHECLSNLERRRIYDSKDEFDDYIPSDTKAKSTKDFFGLFGPIFERNAKWSIASDVPLLGSDKDSYEDALAFYEFWRSFKSWREFSAGEDELDLEDADSREEKRWMDKQNKKVTNKLKKEDYARLMNLVNTACKYDPRVIAWEKKQEEEKLRKKEEKKLAKLKRREDKDRDAREERERIEAEAKAKETAQEDAAKQTALQNKQIRKKRPQIRKFCRLAREAHDEDSKKNPFNPLEEHVEVLCKVMNLSQFNVLTKAFLNKAGPHEFRDMLVEHKVIPADDVYFASPIPRGDEAKKSAELDE